MRRITIITGALLIAGAFWRPAEAQRATISNLAGESLTPRHLARGTLWHSFLSTGAEGARPVEGNYAGLYLDLAYPGFALISWGGRRNERFFPPTTGNSAAPGACTWISRRTTAAATDGGSPPK